MLPSFAAIRERTLSAASPSPEVLHLDTAVASPQFVVDAVVVEILGQVAAIAVEAAAGVVANASAAGIVAVASAAGAVAVALVAGVAGEEPPWTRKLAVHLEVKPFARLPSIGSGD